MHGLLSNKNIRIPTKKKVQGTPLPPALCDFWAEKGGILTSEWLGEVFEGDSADMCTGKFPLVSMGGQANGQACADGERGPPSARAEIYP